MDEKKLVSTELNEKKAAAFKNGDDAAKDKNLTNPIVAQFALKAVFLDRPTYFKAPAQNK
jgi:hypothetical protein